MAMMMMTISLLTTERALYRIKAVVFVLGIGIVSMCLPKV